MTGVNPQLLTLAWLVFAWGVALAVMSSRPGKGQVRSHTLRLAGILSGAVFCLLAAIPIWANTATAQRILASLALVAAGSSWYLGRHARKMDRAMKQTG